MNAAVETMPAVNKPIDINYLSEHGLPVKFGGKTFVLKGQNLADLILREFKSALRNKLNALLN